MEGAKQIKDDPRIRGLHERVWIGYPRAIHIRDQLEGLLVYPKTHRMPNLAIIGETNNGKTMLLESFYRKHAPTEDPNVDEVELPVVMIQTPPEPDEARLYNAFLERVFATGPTREPADSKLRRLKSILIQLRTRMLVLDEFQHALAGTFVKQRRFFNGLKYLGNELQIPIVVAGTPEGLNALQADPQVANRFEPAFLPKWKMGDEYLRLLVSIEKSLELGTPSKLHSPRLAQRILDESEGTIGEMMKLLRSLAVRAVQTGRECLDTDDFSDESLRRVGWLRPSLRGVYRP